MKLEDWQEYVLWAWHDIDGEGNWAASEAGLLVSRQNGKSEDLIAFDLCRLFLFPMPDKRRRTVLHTAHEVKTATESFEKLAAIISSNDRLMELVRHVYTANGREGIVLKPRPGQLMGDRVRFVARSAKSGRGFGAADIVYDEAQELSTQSRSALTYTQSTIRNRQEIFAGTVPADENDSEVWEGVRDRGRSGTARGTCWQEWSPEGAEDPERAKLIDVESEQVWRQGIPALGLWIHRDTVEQQVERATDRDELLRERFSVWPDRPPAEEVKLSELNLQAWIDGSDESVTIEGPGAVIAISVARGGGSATVAAACRRGEKIAVEHKKTGRGTLWVAEYVRDLKKELGNALVVLDAKNAAVIINDLGAMGVKFLSMNMGEVVGAHALLLEHVDAALVEHRPQAEVTASFQFATTRTLVGGLTWAQSDVSKPITQAEAVTWAVWGVKKSEASPPPPPKAPAPPARIITRAASAPDEANLASIRF